MKKQTAPANSGGKQNQREPSAESDAGRSRTRKAENSTLPLVSVIDDQPTMDLAVELLEEVAATKALVDKGKARLDELKVQLVDICNAFDLPGCRFGQIGMEYRGWKTNFILDKAKLLENGVSAETIAASYSETKPYIDARFVGLG